MDESKKLAGALRLVANNLRLNVHVGGMSKLLERSASALESKTQPSDPVAWKVTDEYFTRFESIPRVLRREAVALYLGPVVVHFPIEDLWPEKRLPGGCQLHNLFSGWPDSGRGPEELTYG